MTKMTVYVSGTLVSREIYLFQKGLKIYDDDDDEEEEEKVVVVLMKVEGKD